MVRNLQLNFSHSFNGKVWSIKTDEQFSILILEIREVESMQVEFQLYDFQSNTLKKTIKLDEPWLVSVFYVSPTNLIFQTFESEANPDVKSYIGWNVDENKEIWRNTDWKNVSIVNGQLLVNQDDKWLAFGPADGDSETVKKAIISEQKKSVFTPLFYSSQNEYFLTISRFMKQQGVEKISAGVEYLEYKDLIFISYYYGEQKMANNLLVVDKNKEILLEENIGSELSGIGQDTFFIQHNKLIFVKNKTELFIYQLP